MIDQNTFDTQNIDVEVNMQIKVNNERKVEFEETIAKEYKESSSDKSCNIRKEFKKVRNYNINLIEDSYMNHLQGSKDALVFLPRQKL